MRGKGQGQSGSEQFGYPDIADQVLRFGASTTDFSAATGWGGDPSDRHFNDGSFENGLRIVSAGGGSGSGSHQSQGLMLTPQSFAGPLTLHAAWPGLGMAERSIAISEAALRQARQAIVPLFDN